MRFLLLFRIDQCGYKSAFLESQTGIKEDAAGFCTEQSKHFHCVVISHVLTNNFSSCRQLGLKHRNPWLCEAECQHNVTGNASNQKVNMICLLNSSSPGLLIWLARFLSQVMVSRRWKDIGEVTPEIRTGLGYSLWTSTGLLWGGFNYLSLSLLPRNLLIQEEIESAVKPKQHWKIYKL